MSTAKSVQKVSQCSTISSENQANAYSDAQWREERRLDELVTGHRGHLNNARLTASTLL